MLTACAPGVGAASARGKYSPEWYFYAAAQVLKTAHPFTVAPGQTRKGHMYTLVKEAFQEDLQVDVSKHYGFMNAEEMYKKCWARLRLTKGELNGTCNFWRGKEKG